MPITVKSEMIIPAAGKPCYEQRTQHYLDADGLRRRETRGFESQSDTTDYTEYRISADNGRTWGEWIREAPVTKERCGEDEISEHEAYPAVKHVWNPVQRHFVTLELQRIYLGGYEAASSAYWAGESETDHSYLVVEEEDGTTYPRQLVRYEEGILYDRATYRDEAYCKHNIAMPTGLTICENGDILIAIVPPVGTCCNMLGLDRSVVFPSRLGNGHATGLLMARGVWNKEKKEYDLTFSNALILDDRQSSRGVQEPIITELASGKILVVCRASNVYASDGATRINPYAPNYKYYTISDDGGKTFSPLVPWHFDTREVIYSSATYALFLRSNTNGKLYWFGNITDPTQTQGNYPRYPLQMVEVDEEWGCAKKDTLTVIDTRREGESERVQLSNFCLLEDRETGNIELYLSKIGQDDNRHEFDCETWKYTITID